MNSRYFTFNGEASIDKNIHVINFEDDYYENISFGGRNIEVELFNNGKKGNIGLSEELLRIELLLTKMNKKGELLEWNDRDFLMLSDWLIKDNFSPFSFEGSDKIYYAMVDHMEPLMQDRLGQGFIEVHFVTSSSHAWTRQRVHVADTIENKIRTELFNESTIGSQISYPEIIINAKSKTDVSIHNLRDQNELVIKNLDKFEEVRIDNENLIITSSIPNKNVFKDFNRNWFRTLRGSNLIDIKGDVLVEFRDQYAIL